MTQTPIKTSKGKTFTHLVSKEGGVKYPLKALNVCEETFSPLEVAYDYDEIRRQVSRETIEAGPNSIWRYKAFLPVESENPIDVGTGMTPLVKSNRLARRLGLKNLYIKNDAVNMPTLSFKDRVVSVALTRARELGFSTVSCASTGNLANSTAAIAAHAGLDCCVFIPSDLEAGKVLGTLIYNPTLMAVKGNYDQVNRLCSEVGNTYGWGFVNINLRPYYSEGSKTLGYEVAEQLGWELPDHIVAPLAYCQACWPLSLEFSEPCNQCLYNRKDECVTTQPWEPATTFECPDKCPARGPHFSGNIGDRHNPHQYIACFHGQTVGCIACPKGLQFNEKWNACLYEGKYKTERDVKPKH